ncbi:MAG: response regulator transcription factor [Actinobacteria bacterium]|nr:MAG: response regulator transcription factor [Actinomycetota bacterium]
MIRLIVAEDHAVVRQGLEQLLGAAPDLEVAGSAADGEEAVSMAAQTRPDVVLMDLEMPRMDGIEATRRILDAGQPPRVVVLTSFSDRERILDALDAGAIGYLLKDAEPEELLRGIRAAARGESPLDPKAAGTLLAAREARRAAHPLSERQQAVLRLVARGHPNKLIARELDISEKTVKAHLTAIFQALEVTDRTQAALWAQRHGLG